MRIGLVSYWFNRGQAHAARQLRGLLDDLGHETCVLARPTKASFQLPSFIDREDVWAQPGVTAASSFLIPAAEYEAWALANGLDLVLLDQNYQFDEIGRLRRLGVRTVGRFVWEAFTEDHVEGALRAYDTVYAFTDSEHRRYHRLGIPSVRVPWGCHPEWIHDPPARPAGAPVTFLFPGGYLSRRKPLAEVVEAFGRIPDPALRLLIRVQGTQPPTPPARAQAGDDPRITVLEADLPQEEHRALMLGADVLLAPSRWEGLGMHLFEATAAGLPIITNDRPPMSEVVRHRENGLLVRSIEVEPASSGIPAYDPDLASLTAAIAELADAGRRAELVAGTRRARARLSWDHTIAGFSELVGRT